MVERYTKLVLTVIAACLVWNTVFGSNNKLQALAQSGPVNVVVDQWGAHLATFPVPVRQQ
jgi:hypothetical protein